MEDTTFRHQSHTYLYPAPVPISDNPTPRQVRRAEIGVWLLAVLGVLTAVGGAVVRAPIGALLVLGAGFMLSLAGLGAVGPYYRARKSRSR